MLGTSMVSVIHRILTWTAGSLTCAQMLMHAIAHGGTARECALKVDSGRKKPVPHRGIEPASASFRSDALPELLRRCFADWGEGV